jgi:SAM-dependent methyltransferase
VSAIRTPPDKRRHPIDEGLRPEEEPSTAAREDRDRSRRDWRLRGVGGQGCLWQPRAVFNAPADVLGAYPKGFLAWAARLLQVRRSDLLHVCSGTLPAGEGTRVDCRPAARPDILADGRALPFRDGAFPAVLLDPPYSPDYAQDLYGTDYPRPAHLLAEAARVVRPCGRVGILHFLTPMIPPGCRLLSIHGVTQGLGYRIRALTIYQRDQASLW